MHPLLGLSLVAGGLCPAPRAPSANLSMAFFLHVPKAGTGFALAVMRAACTLPEAATLEGLREGARGGRIMERFLETADPVANCRPGALQPGIGGARQAARPLHAALAGHIPLRAWLADSGRGVAMVRHPAKRIVSAHHYGQRVGAFQSGAAPPPVAVLAYAAAPGIAGCQVKMLTGQWCNAVVRVAREDAAVAIRRLSTALAFVGITDYWNASVCLFAAQFGAAPGAADFANSRPTPYGGQRARHESQVADSGLERFDFALYAAAVRLFAARLDAHGIERPPGLAEDLALAGGWLRAAGLEDSGAVAPVRSRLGGTVSLGTAGALLAGATSGVVLALLAAARCRRPRRDASRSALDVTPSRPGRTAPASLSVRRGLVL